MDARWIADLEAGMKRRLMALPERLRPLTRERETLPRAVILTGPRGVGKTTYLLHHARGGTCLYFSADHPVLAGRPLYETVKAIFMAGYEGAIVDEVHYAKDWSLHLKALYDDFPGHRLWASDSSSLGLRSGVGDLSRRFVPLRLPIMSFREFLYLETGTEYPVVDPFKGELPGGMVPGPGILSSFRAYRAGGTRPFYGEGDFAERLVAVLDKTLYADIPFFLPSVTDGNLRLMKAITSSLASQAIPRLQVRSLCADWGIGAEKLYQLLNVMESVGLVRIVRKERDAKAKSAGDKLFFADPAYYPVLGGNPGTAREAMVAALCADSGWLVESTREETTGDFFIRRSPGAGAVEPATFRLEGGGASNRPKAADFVIRDDIDLPSSNAIPLWLLGMMY